MLSGLANAHTHIYSALAPFGMPPPHPAPASFPEILERIWWRLDRAIDEDALAASARYYAAEALLAGTTVLVDHHESPSYIEGSLDVLADACQAIGVRAVLCYGATERNGGRDEARRGLQECRRFMLANRRPLIRGVIGLHASFTVSDETIRDAGQLCRDLGTVLHVHLAEDRVDVDDARARGFAGPLERLMALEALPPGSILAHGVHLSRRQVGQAMDAGCWIVQNPRSNRTNRVGYPAALGTAPRVALGTDGFVADMMSERVALMEVGRDAGEPSSVLDARCVGSLRLAAALFGDAMDAVPEERSVPHWLERRAATARAETAADGRTVVSNGRLMTADADTLREDARRAAQRLWARLPGGPP
jgi:cytosine/adenosine deaminase-related metal-dependent hydrolase